MQRAKFRKIDELTSQDFAIIENKFWDIQPGVADRVLELLRSLEHLDDGFPINQLEHALQSATRAERDGADEQIVLAALCHDVGKAIGIAGHEYISAAILRPYLESDIIWIIENHQLIQGRHYLAHAGINPDIWKRLQDHPTFERAWQFVRDYDEPSFDRDYRSLPLTHFEPLVRKWFAEPRSHLKA